MATKKIRPSLPPRLSLKERDRRYRLIRKKMAQEGIDVLILPGNHRRWGQMMADSVYVTTMGGFSAETETIFPLEGNVTAFVFNNSEFWSGTQDWVKDVRNGRNHASANAIQKLNEMRFKNGRIGFSGLAGLTRSPDGAVNYRTIIEIQKAFPAAEIVDATNVIADIRAVKSPEEIGMMRHSREIVEKMIYSMMAEAKVGATERHIYAAMVYTLLDNGAEFPSLLNFSTGKHVGTASGYPTDRVLEPGDTIENEVEAKYGGYAAQGVQPIYLGKPSKTLTDLYECSASCIDNVIAKMRPGVNVGTLMETYKKTVQKEGKGRYFTGYPLMHARGLGDDNPAILHDALLDQFKNVELKAGMTFIVKPPVISARTKEAGRLGDTVLVTKNGGERLGKRPLGLAVV